jgi:predicted MFS family arabinose efflux permease
VLVIATFALFGVFWGAWGASLPQIEHAARAGSGTLGLALLLVGVGALGTMRLTGHLSDRLGPMVVPGTLVTLAFTWMLPPLARSSAVLAATLLLVGASSGAYDVTINTAAADTEAATRRPILSLAHASYSGAVVATSLAVGVAIDGGATPQQVFAVSGAITAVFVVVLVTDRHVQRTAAGPRAAATPATEAPGAGSPARVGRPLLILGGICGLSYFVEGAWQNWGAIHIERTFGGSPALGAAGPAIFAMAAVVGRLSSHGLSHRFSTATALRTAGAMAACGTVVAAAAPSAGVALGGISIAGLGTSICAPLVFSLTGQVADPGRRGAATSTVNTIAYLGFVLGPAFVGVVAASIGLRRALALMALAALALAVLSRNTPVPPAEPRQSEY